MGMSKTQEFSKHPPSVGGLLRVHWLYRSELWRSLCFYNNQVSNWRSPKFEVSIVRYWHIPDIACWTGLLHGCLAIDTSSLTSSTWLDTITLQLLLTTTKTLVMLANDLDKDSLPIIPTTQDYWACSRFSTKCPIIRNGWSDSRRLTHFVRWDDEQWWK